MGTVDDDGDFDVILCNLEDANTIWTNDGKGIFTESDQVLGDTNSFTVGLGDFDGDGVVGGADLSIMLGGWGVCSDPTDCIADLTGDGLVNGADLSLLLGAWGLCP